MLSGLRMTVYCNTILDRYHVYGDKLLLDLARDLVWQSSTLKIDPNLEV